MTVASARLPAALVDGEFPFTPDDFSAIAEMLVNETGIYLADAKATLVYSRLAKRIRKLGLKSFKQYRDLVTGPAGESERGAMISALTTNVTRFFREPHHFEDLKNSVMPRLAATAKAGGRVRLWSAACSSGEEPYSIALTILEQLPNAASYDLRILATDIDQRVLETAARGQYRSDALDPVPELLRRRWFEESDGQWTAKPELRSLVTFKPLNLIGAWPFQGPFDVIFCRNVVIYFEEATQSQLWTRFREKLAGDGRLYVGHSERVDVPGFASEGHTIYKLDTKGRKQ